MISDTQKTTATLQCLIVYVVGFFFDLYFLASETVCTSCVVDVDLKDFYESGLYLNVPVLYPNRPDLGVWQDPAV